MREEKEFELKSTTMVIQPSNYISLTIKKDVELTLEDAIEINQLAYETINGQPFVIVIISNQISSDISNDAMEYFATDKKIVDLRLAQALVVKSLAHRLIASLYMSLQKRSAPIKVFKEEELAKDWLTNILNNHS